jgi:hypothetical protein
VKLTTHFHLVPGLKSAAIPPVPHTSSWRGVQLKHRDNFTFYLLHNDHFGEREGDGRITLRWLLGKWDVKLGLDGTD